MEKIIRVLIILIISVIIIDVVVLCFTKNSKNNNSTSDNENNFVITSDSYKLKNDYEGLNNKYVDVNIPINSDVTYIDLTELQSKISNKDNFIILLGNVNDDSSRVFVSEVVSELLSYNYAYYYVEMSGVKKTSDEYNNLKKLLNIEDVPAICHLDKGKIKKCVYQLEGYKNGNYSIEDINNLKELLRNIL